MSHFLCLLKFIPFTDINFVFSKPLNLRNQPSECWNFYRTVWKINVSRRRSANGQKPLSWTVRLFIQRYDWLPAQWEANTDKHFPLFTSKFGYNLHSNSKWPLGRAADHHASILRFRSHALTPHLPFLTLGFRLDLTDKTSVIQSE